MHVLGLLTVTLAAALMSEFRVNGQSVEVAEELLHSDLPIFGHGSEDEWPQHYEDKDSFGCASRVAFGDWAFRIAGSERENDVQWYRFSNYGAFHCWANTFRAYERAGLDGADFHPSFFVFLGIESVDRRDAELWALQIGARPGSDYLLLSRAPKDGLIESFSVLQTACSRADQRNAGSLDILITRYCVVGSRAQLIRLARRMAQE